MIARLGTLSDHAASAANNKGTHGSKKRRNRHIRNEFRCDFGRIYRAANRRAIQAIRRHEQKSAQDGVRKVEASGGKTTQVSSRSAVNNTERKPWKSNSRASAESFIIKPSGRPEASIQAFLGRPWSRRCIASSLGRPQHRWAFASLTRPGSILTCSLNTASHQSLGAGAGLLAPEASPALITQSGARQ